MAVAEARREGLEGMEKLQVVMVAHSYPPYIGGLSYVVDNLSKALAEMGHSVEVVTLDTSGKLPRVEERRGVVVYRFRGYAPDGGYFAPGPGFVKHIARSSGDVYHLHNIGALTVPVAAATLWARGIGYAVTPHHHEKGYKWHARMLWKPYRLVAKRVLRRARVVQAVSAYEAVILRRDFRVDSVIVPNGVAEDVFRYKWRPPRGETVLVYAGRVEEYKRVHLLPEVASLLRGMMGGGEVVVRVIGDGPAMERVARMAEKHRVPLDHRGFLPRDKYLGALATSTLLVNPSSLEAFSIVAAEALAIGMPVVVVKPWGENFRGYASAFIADPSPEDIARKAFEALNTPRNGRGRRVLGWREVARQVLEKVYQPLLR